jgi:hypothetical protein
VCLIPCFVTAPHLRVYLIPIGWRRGHRPAPHFLQYRISPDNFQPVVSLLPAIAGRQTDCRGRRPGPPLYAATSLSNLSKPLYLCKLPPQAGKQTAMATDLPPPRYAIKSLSNLSKPLYPCHLPLQAGGQTAMATDLPPQPPQPPLGSSVSGAPPHVEGCSLPQQMHGLAWPHGSGCGSSSSRAAAAAAVAAQTPQVNARVCACVFACV